MVPSSTTEAEDEVASDANSHESEEAHHYSSLKSHSIHDRDEDMVQELQDISYALWFVLVVGGVGRVGADRSQWFYRQMWFACLAICILLCIYNMFFDDSAPFGSSLTQPGRKESLLLQLCMVWAHVVAWHSSVLWYGILRSSNFKILFRSSSPGKQRGTSLSMVTPTDVPDARGPTEISNNTQTRRATLMVWLKLFSMVAAGLLLAFSAYVSTTLVLPAFIEATGIDYFPGIEQADRNERCCKLFPLVHAIAMFFLALPTVGSLLVCPLMFVTTIYLHYTAAQIVVARLQDGKFRRDLVRSKSDLVRSGSSTHSDETLADLECGTHVYQLGRGQGRRLGEIVYRACKPALDAQKQLTATCETFHIFLIHLVAFMVFEIVAVVRDVTDVPVELAHETDLFRKYVGKYLEMETHAWYWTLNLIINIIYPCCMFSTCFLVPCFVTQVFQRLARRCCNDLVDQHVSILVLADCNVMNFLEKSLEGWTFLGWPIQFAGSCAGLAVTVAVAGALSPSSSL